MAGGGNMNLPPGFLFSPTDEELILHFLYRKASLLPCYPNIIPDLDLSLLDPWQLCEKALSSGNQLYFFTKVKENRATENGYWKEISVTKPIVSASDKKVGMKKQFIFNIGKAPHGTETNWVMQEYHICSSGFSAATSYYGGRRRPDQSKGKWILCRVCEKRSQQQDIAINCYSDDEDDSGTELSWLDEVFLSLDDDLEEVISPS